MCVRALMPFWCLSHLCSSSSWWAKNIKLNLTLFCFCLAYAVCPWPISICVDWRYGTCFIIQLNHIGMRSLSANSFFMNDALRWNSIEWSINKIINIYVNNHLHLHPFIQLMKTKQLTWTIFLFYFHSNLRCLFVAYIYKYTNIHNNAKTCVNCKVFSRNNFAAWYTLHSCLETWVSNLYIRYVSILR